MKLLYTLFLGLCLKGSLQEVRVYGSILENAEMLCDSFKVRYNIINLGKPIHLLLNTARRWIRWIMMLSFGN